MKVFFDTNVYVAEALLGEMAEALVQATQRANWRIVTNTQVLYEVRRVLAESLGFSVHFANLIRQRVGRRADREASFRIENQNQFVCGTSCFSSDASYSVT